MPRKDLVSLIFDALEELVESTTVIFARKTLGQKLREFERKDWRKVTQALRRLEKQHLVILKEQGDDFTISISRRGRKRLKKYRFQKLQIPKPKRWDGKWRIVIFDIPNKRQKARDAFRQKIKSLGFYPLQESVFAFPYHCEDEIIFIAEILQIIPYITYFPAASLGNKENEVKDFFGLA
jgi:DNA-binding transcriptional regulator PaaX